MKVLDWFMAYMIVYLGLIKSLSKQGKYYLAALIVIALVAAALGPLGTVALLVVILFVLPAINSDVRQAVDREYRNLRK